MHPSFIENEPACIHPPSKPKSLKPEKDVPMAVCEFVLARVFSI